MTALELQTKRDDGRLLVSAVGPINRHTLGTLREHLRRTLAPQGIHVELDLEQCTSVDVDGLLALDVAYSDAREHGSRLRLTNASPLIRRMIDQHNLSHLLDTSAHQAHSNGATIRAHSSGDPGLAEEVPEGDAYEQQLPADPDEDELDTDEPTISEGIPLPLEADSADVNEQRLIVPLDDGAEDDPAAPQGHNR